MQDLNSGTLVCRLAADPELRSLPSGMSVANLRVAFNTSKKNQASGEWEDVGNFIDVKVWGRQAETVASTQSKGKRIGITYRLEVETWQAQDGSNRSKAVLVAERIQFLDPRDSDGGGNGGGFTPRAQPASQHQPATHDDDDIPF